MQTLVANLLWTDFAPMRMAGIPAGRRMTAARNGRGQMVVFSPLPWSENHEADLRALGAIAAFVVPSRFHDACFSGYVLRFFIFC